MNDISEESQIVIYKDDDGKSRVSLYLRDGSVWLSQNQIAELFGTSKQNISQHIVAIFKDKELDEASVVKNYFTTASDGKKYDVVFYSLEMILAIGFRVRGKRGVQFRMWANQNLAQYMVKGFVIDDDRLKNPDGRPDYFDELDTLNRLVVIFMETAELRAKNHQNITMKFWQENINNILFSNGYEVLDHKGSITNFQMEKKVRVVYDEFDSKRKAFEAMVADEEDLKELENLVKNK